MEMKILNTAYLSDVLSISQHSYDVLLKYQMDER
jgi:hypothetical protein